MLESEVYNNCSSDNFKEKLLFEFYLPKILLDVHFQNITSFHFHRGFHYVHSQMRSLLKVKKKLMVSFASQKSGFKCLNQRGFLSGKSILPFLCDVILLQSPFRALYFTLNFSMLVLSSVYFETMQFLSRKCFSLILNKSNFKAFINFSWICFKNFVIQRLF